MNLTIRFSELTKARVSSGRDGRPNNCVVRLTETNESGFRLAATHEHCRSLVRPGREPSATL
jgi:hypothetical protein